MLHNIFLLKLESFVNEVVENRSKYERSNVEVLISDFELSEDIFEVFSLGFHDVYLVLQYFLSMRKRKFLIRNYRFFHLGSKLVLKFYDLRSVAFQD